VRFVDFAATLGLLRRRWFALVLCLVMGLGGAVYRTSRTPDTYATSARLIVSVPAARNAGEALVGVQLTSQLMKSYGEVATSLSAAERVKRRLALPESVADVRAKIFASPEPETLLISVGATDGDPVRARTIADAAADVFIQLVAELESGNTDKVEARFVDRATTPSARVSPQPRNNLLIGGVLGLVAGAVLALMLEALDRSLKTPAQGVHLFGAPMLSLLPRRRDAASKQLVTVEDPLSQASEAYRSLRTAVRFLDPDNPLRTLLVTSPSAGEGKTSTAANLAIALAQSGERVVLVDADLRRARVAEMFGLEGAVGLTNVIRRQLPVADALQGWQDTVAVLASGPLPPNPSEILGSQSMTALVDELSALADIVIFDAPPVLPVTDAVVLATQVDGVLVVARYGRTQRSLAAEAHRRLQGVGAHIVGFVLNGVPNSASRGYYEDYRYITRDPVPILNRRVTDLFAGRRGR
jgi:capsular exopolysaccharide synthesis family protein